MGCQCLHIEDLVEDQNVGVEVSAVVMYEMAALTMGMFRAEPSVAANGSTVALLPVSWIIMQPGPNAEVSVWESSFTCMLFRS